MQSNRQGWRKSTKVILITTVAMMVLGLGMLLAGVAMGGLGTFQDFTMFGHKIHFRSAASVVEDMTELEEFNKMNITVHGTRVCFVNDDRYYLEACYEEGWPPLIDVQEGTLTVVDGYSLQGATIQEFDAAGTSTDTEKKAGDQMLVVGGADGPTQIYITDNDGNRIALETDDDDLEDVIEDALERQQNGYGHWEIDLGGLTGAGSDTEPTLYIHCPLSKVYEEVTVQGEYASMDVDGLKAKTLSLSSSSGDFRVQNFEAETMNVNSSYADLFLDNGQMQTLSITSSGDDISLKNLTVRGEAALQDDDYLDVNVVGSSFGSFSYSTANGDLEMDNVEVKTATTVRTEYGDVDISGKLTGKIDVVLEGGEVELDLAGNEADYDYALNADAGEATVDGRAYKNTAGGKQNAKHTIQIDSAFGDIELRFH